MSNLAKQIDIHPDITHGVIKMQWIINQYKNLLKNDSEIEKLLSQLYDWLKRASDGDQSAIRQIIKNGRDLVLDVIALLPDDEADELDFESEGLVVIAEDSGRSGNNYMQLRHDLIDFEDEYLYKIQSIEVL